MSSANTIEPATYGVAKSTGFEMKVVLSSKEAQICDLLNDVAEHLKSTKPELPPVTLRIAGGWVRDKLLRKDCHDLDVAVSTMMGYDFAQHVNDYLQSKGYETRSIAKIDSNPDKSKHLETATTKLFDQEIDFVNLRNEIYNEDSRIPAEVTYGSPSEDAYRRDITINTLFYNVHTLEVEDYTQKVVFSTRSGLEDLANGLIRTPLPAFKTFCDDPLRVLRCIRFASRFGFDIVDDIVQAVKEEKIKYALLAKISRERIGIEVDKMIRGPSPKRSLELIQSFGLYEIVFAPPADIHEGTLQNTESGVHAVQLVEWLSKQRLSNLSPEEGSEQIRQLYLASNLLPYRNITYTQKGRVYPAVGEVLHGSLKTKNEDVTTISKVHKCIEPIQQVVRRNADSTINRSDLGMLIRSVTSVWPLAVKVSLIADLLPYHQEIIRQSEQSDLSPEVQQIISLYENLVRQTAEYGITDCYNLKPILDGKTIAKTLSIKPGPAIRELLEKVMAWQLENPSGTADECKAYITEVWQRRQ
ncbi:CCA tRNA nucleotidyltransferase, mitochondrial [Umbelopsis sp. WA50703]